MIIKEITDKSQWENFISGQKPDTFLHSWNWGEFNLAMGCKIFRLGIFKNNELIGVALIIRIDARRGKFLFCPQGPITENEKLWNYFFNYLKELAKKEKVDFVRISPLLENNAENLEIFKKNGFRDAPIHMMHPEQSWVLDISKTEEEILKGMRKTTRNLIYRAEREGVRVAESKNIEDIDKFYQLHRQTVGRHNFVPFSRNYFKNQFETFLPDNKISLFFAEHNGQLLSAAIIVFNGESAYYHHGASLSSKIPASHSLIWKAIRESKKRGLKIFNFWGIAPENKKNHPWAGLTLFKTGFGGRKKEYLHAQDLVINSKYWFNYLVEKIRRFNRGY